MGGAVAAVQREVADVGHADAACDVLGDLVLARIAVAGGATRADLIRDLAPIASHRLSPSEMRHGIDGRIEALGSIGAIDDHRGRFSLTDEGAAKTAAVLGERKLEGGWAQVRDVRLMAAALGVPAEPAMLKALDRPDGLRSLILQKHYGVGGRRCLSSSRLRMALAVVALERAFGNKIKGGLGAGRDLSVKASRLLAGQLSRRPRDFGTDTRLITALAVEAVGASQSDPASLRQAVLRRWVAERLGPNAPDTAPDNGVKVPAKSVEASAATAGPTVVAPEHASSRPRPAAASRPDFKGFVATVLKHASAEADGWPGNRKAFIGRVWRAVSAAHPEWGLSEIEFKSMLAETHRTGHVVLGSADIKSKANLADVQESAIAYKNTVWHFIRVEN